MLIKIGDIVHVARHGSGNFDMCYEAALIISADMARGDEDDRWWNVKYIKDGKVAYSRRELYFEENSRRYSHLICTERERFKKAKIIKDDE